MLALGALDAASSKARPMEVRIQRRSQGKRTELDGRSIPVEATPGRSAKQRPASGGRRASAGQMDCAVWGEIGDPAARGFDHLSETNDD